ncbi:hypothetical protein [Chitinilyticum litopenaei]|uniref:hypothetical protein n=1 Tax=Chitinilyticum litopenaei TaxID=1121276 RepID=UPI000687B9F4|nr:hypothetical protein [Chitinilyticum litopenaei]
MNKNVLAVRWVRAAVLYLLAGVVLGNVMGATHTFTFRSLHAHINLLGWASMLGVGLLIKAFGDSLNLRLANIQFWLYQAGVAAMLLSLFAVQMGIGALEPLLGLSSMLVAVAVALLAFTLFTSRLD